MNSPIQREAYEVLPMLPSAEYHQHPAISWSKLKFFSENFPATYEQKYIQKVLEPEDQNKEHFDIGNAVEAYFSYGKTAFEELCPHNPYSHFKTQTARDWRDELRAAGKIPLSTDNRRLVHRMFDALMRNKLAVDLRDRSTAQCAFRFNGSNASLQSKPDFFGQHFGDLPDGTELGAYDCDLKTIESLSPSAFMSFDKQAMNLGYHRAAAFYRYVIRKVLAGRAKVPEAEVDYTTRIFIVVDKKEWPSCTVYKVPPSLIDSGQAWVMQQLSALFACMENNNWPDAPMLKELDPPAYFLRKENEYGY